MMSPLSRLPEGISVDNPYKDLMDRMKEVDDSNSGDTRDTRPPGGERGEREEERGVDPTSRPAMPPFSILPPHMLNMMERIKSEEGAPREGEAINLTSQDRDRQKGVSDGR